MPLFPSFFVLSGLRPGKERRKRGPKVLVIPPGEEGKKEKKKKDFFG